MRTFFKSPWSIGVGTAVLSIILMRILDKIADTKLLLSSWNFVKKIIKFFNAEYIVTLWFLILISFSVLIIFILYFYLRSTLNNVTNELPDAKFLNYTSDNFDGVLYKWKYFKDFNSKYSATDYVAYCPKDNCILLDSTCSICNEYYRNIKDRNQLEVLVSHRIENNLFENKQ